MSGAGPDRRKGYWGKGLSKNESDNEETDFYERYEDNHFDVVMTRGHLMHIPLSDSKRKYIDELKRIGKYLVLIEPVDPRFSETELYFDKTYALAWDDYAKEYGMTRPDFLDKRESIFVWSNLESIPAGSGRGAVSRPGLGWPGITSEGNGSAGGSVRNYEKTNQR